MRTAALSGLLIILLPLAAAGQTSTAASYLCYRGKPTRATKAASLADTASITAGDRFGSSRVVLRHAVALCQAATTATGTPVSWSDGLAVQDADAARSRPRGPRRIGQQVDVVNRFGRTRVTVEALDRIAMSATLAEGTAAGTAPAQTATLTCYTVAARKTPGRGDRIVLTDGLGERLFTLRRPKRLCVDATPEGARELLCYGVTLARTRPLKQSSPPARVMAAASARGTQALRIRDAVELCVPSLPKSNEPTSTTTPPTTTPPSTTTPTTLPPPPPSAGFTLRVTPTSLSVLAGDKPQLAATAYFDAGGSADYTDRVIWRSNDESIVIPIGEPGRPPVEAVGPGTAKISAVDPESGVDSADGNGDATIEVTWPLEKLTIEPHAVTRKPDSFESYTVTGHFTGGQRRNLTQRVRYSVFDPWVAEAPNTTGTRSRVSTRHPGRTLVRAEDPISGITTADSGNDATLRVRGDVQWLRVEAPSYFSIPALFPGESMNLTAIAHYGDGSTLTITQRCNWESNDPAVVSAPGLAPNRGRVTAVAMGTASVTCNDPESGLASYATIDVVGQLESISINPVWPALRLGETRGLTAFGQYAPFGGFSWRGLRNVTQDVVWTSRDPDLVTTPNEPGRRSNVVAVGGGMARVFATDPVSGVVSDDAHVPSLGTLQEIAITRGVPRFRVGDTPPAPFKVTGIFEGGFFDLSRFAPEEYVFESSNPAVIAVVDGKRDLRALAGGFATITARHVGTGLVSNGHTVEIRGPLEELVLEPPAVVRGIGETEAFTAIGVHPPNWFESLSQDVVYTSSDPSVVVAPNAVGDRSRVRTVGAGTATITATHAPSGLAASAVVTVLPGTLERITIQPGTVTLPFQSSFAAGSFAFTAIGHYANGQTLNVTQQVEWASGNPAIVSTPNTPTDRSRVVGMLPGTAKVSARHPSGVSSVDTNDFGSVIVKPLGGITVSPPSRTGRVGETVRFTVEGTYLDGTTVNLTQDTSFWTNDQAVALTDQDEDDRSAVRLVGVGTTNIRVLWGAVLVGTATITVEP